MKERSCKKADKINTFRAIWRSRCAFSISQDCALSLRDLEIAQLQLLFFWKGKTVIYNNYNTSKQGLIRVKNIYKTGKK